MDFSKLKQQLEAYFQALQHSVEAGELPNLRDVAAFVQMAERMHMNAREDWLSEAEDFLHLSRQLHLAVKNKHLRDAVLLLDALQDAQEFCRRTYRNEG